MKTNKLALFSGICLLALAACSGGEGKKAPVAADTTANTQQLDPKAIVDSVKANNPILSQHNNEQNPLKFVLTHEEYMLFGNFCAASSYAKQLNNEDWVLLAPMDRAFKGLTEDELRELKRPENRKILDDFIGRHIIRVPFSIYKLQDDLKVENILGKSVTPDLKTLTLDGAKYTSLEFKTRIGTVICMEEAIGLDKEAIKALSKKKK